MGLGPLMLDLRGTALEAEERELLRHPLVGGLILFTRNYESPGQLATLLEEVHALRDPRLLVAVDHEGGPVQRFRRGFTALPPSAALGRLHAQSPREARRMAEACGRVMASELRAVGVDFSFAPVLDLGRGISQVIGERAFHSDPETVADLAGAFMHGMRHAGMAATGKHFPGHGGVADDSHEALPVDDRPLEAILAEDLRPFARLARDGLAAVMPAHVVYPSVDSRPAGFSPFWLQEILRKRLGFQGLIFSDDLSMEGAAGAGGSVERAESALDAGCDMILLCNDRRGAVELLDRLPYRPDPVKSARLMRMHGRHPVSRESLEGDPEWQQARMAVERLNMNPTQELEL